MAGSQNRSWVLVSVIDESHVTCCFDANVSQVNHRICYFTFRNIFHLIHEIPLTSLSIFLATSMGKPAFQFLIQVRAPHTYMTHSLNINRSFQWSISSRLLKANWQITDITKRKSTYKYVVFQLSDAKITTCNVRQRQLNVRSILGEYFEVFLYFSNFSFIFSTFSQISRIFQYLFQRNFKGKVGKCRKILEIFQSSPCVWWLFSWIFHVTSLFEALQGVWFQIFYFIYVVTHIFL